MAEEKAKRELPVFGIGVGLPEELRSAPRFRKKVLTQAVRIEGPFMVETSEGVLRCEDGWLALDQRGYPYPIAANEFDLIYEPVDQSDAIPDTVPDEWDEPHGEVPL